MIAVSACLLGEDCKYNGGNNYNKELDKLLKDEDIILICPETFGELKSPRPPAEIQGGDGNDVLNAGARVVDKEGRDVTDNFIKGANKALDLISKNNCKLAILKARSPSCGTRRIYNGNFNGNKKVGVGVATALLKEEGIEVLNEEELDEIKKKV